MLKSTTVPFLALCFAGFLTAANAVSTTTFNPAPASGISAVEASTQVAQATPVAPAPVAQAPVPGAAPAAPTTTPVSPAKADSAKPAVPVAVVDSAKHLIGITDSARVADSLKTAAAATASADSSAAVDSADAKTKARKRKRVVRETTVNTIDDLKGRYRSPKKALFMSMVVPGLGQAYVGQSGFNYARGAVYFLTDVALAYGWRYYVVDKQDAQIAKYKRFADKNWSQWAYEDSVSKNHWDSKVKDTRFPHRQTYCEAVQNRETAKGNNLYNACLEPSESKPDYSGFKNEYDDRDPLPLDSIAKRRDNFANSHNFYEMIGKEPEFIFGWADADSIVTTDSAFYRMGTDGKAAKDLANRFIIATSPFQQQYVGMRTKANDYARMQAYFLGGMVVNHIVSAIDAALTAHYHNKSLYQTETNWYDRLRLDSQLAWDGYAPTPTVTASFTF